VLGASAGSEPIADRGDGVIRLLDKEGDGSCPHGVFRHLPVGPSVGLSPPYQLLGIAPLHRELPDFCETPRLALQLFVQGRHLVKQRLDVVAL